MSDADILARLNVTESHPEGLFFPDTYLFGKGASDLAVLRRSYRAMARHLKEEWEARDPTVPYHSPYEALIMASIIEKETGQAGERDMIGGVLVNRLRIGMRLQVDPTIIYGLGTAFDGNLKRSHLAEDGPYNTYTRAGLPPTPIAMPGLASLRAAVRPGKTDAMYYVSRNDGSSHFSRTLEEHNRAVARYQLRGGGERAGQVRDPGRRGRSGQVHSPEKFVADFVATRRAARHPDARARRHRPRRAAARGDPLGSDDARGRDAAPLRGSRRPRRARDPARARGRDLGGLRPLYRRDRRVPGSGGRACPAT